MKILFVSILVILSGPVIAQTNLEQKATQIEAEGMRLYKREKASWHGTDLFMEKYKDRSKIGGYFSYINAHRPTCIFFSRDLVPKVIGTIAFDSSYNLNDATIDLGERSFTATEEELYTLRKLAFEALTTDTIFHFYEDTNPNLIPIISEGEKKVYVITGASKSGVVPLGNDYLLHFTDGSKLKNIERLHRSLIMLETSPKDSTGRDLNGVTTMHTHLPEYSPFITPTDICTLLLYSKATNWEQHYVISKDYVTIWVASGNKVIIMTREVWAGWESLTQRSDAILSQV